jgi:hypothetical protein
MGLVGNLFGQKERGSDPRPNCSPFSDKFGNMRNGLEEVIRKVTLKYKDELMIKLQISMCERSNQILVRLSFFLYQYRLIRSNY